MTQTTDRDSPQTRPSADLIPNLLEKRAALIPNNVYAEYPISSYSYDQGYRRILFADLTNAVNAYMGPNDIRYPALFWVQSKLATLYVFLTLPRNSIAAHASLLDRLRCSVVLSPASQSPAVNAIEKAGLGRVVDVPELDYLLNILHPPYPYDKTLSDASQEPLFIVLILRQDMKVKIGCIKETVFSSPFLLFIRLQGAYLASYLFNAIPFGTTMIAPISGVIPSAEGLIAGLRKTLADVAFIVPSIVQELGETPDFLEYCSQKLKAIFYCEGDLPQLIGDTVASKIKLVNQFGATELGLTPNLLFSHGRSAEDWKYVQFHPELGLTMRPAADDTYELCAIRDDNLRETQPTFTIFPDTQEYASRDLFVRHPSSTKRDMWKWKARADDIIVFLNGEKTNPISMEQYIVSSSAEVAAALVIGAQRFQAALLVELVGDREELTPTERAKYIEELWPTIVVANHDAPSHARITKSHILFPSPQKPMMRAEKGTVQRAGTLQAYQEEIEALYRDSDQLSGDTNTHTVHLLENADETTLLRYIKETILSITGWAEVADKENIFATGMDSLHAILLVHNTLYTNTSPAALARALLAMRNEHDESQSTHKKDRLANREGLLQEYTRKIDQLPLPSSRGKAASSRIIVLTGSTGALGSYILRRLLADPTVQHVYCLNRAPESHHLQIERNSHRQVVTDLSADRVTFYTCDLSSSDLGLRADVYEVLVASGPVIIHCAWPVDFNLSVDAFRPQLDGVVNLVELASRSKQASRLFFVSSINSVMSCQSPKSRIPEEIIDMHTTVHPIGYAESKYLSELILQHASKKLSVDCSVARVGQLTGAAQGVGAWNPAEWFPSLVISSAHTGALPSSLGSSFDNMSWIPIDLAAEIIVDIAVTNGQPEPHYDNEEASPLVYHLVNPFSVHWQSMRSTVARTISHFISKPLEIVSPTTWIAKVRDSLETTMLHQAGDKKQELDEALRLNLAAKLLDFYTETMRQDNSDGAQWDQEKTMAQSKRLRDIPALKEEWMEKWVGEWLHGLGSGSV
ncbi:MAG: hypothetical protein Q9221_007019 [Calogaya cf. arnoldii]